MQYNCQFELQLTTKNGLVYAINTLQGQVHTNIAGNFLEKNGNTLEHYIIIKNKV